MKHNLITPLSMKTIKELSTIADKDILNLDDERLLNYMLDNTELRINIEDYEDIEQYHSIKEQCIGYFKECLTNNNF